MTGTWKSAPTPAGRPIDLMPRRAGPYTASPRCSILQGTYATVEIALGLTDVRQPISIEMSDVGESRVRGETRELTVGWVQAHPR